MLPQTPRVVITGSASGFGRALALRLARRGAHLWLNDIDLDGCEGTAEDARAAGASEVRVHQCDVRDVGQVQAVADACEGPIDLVVNNAGVASGGRVGELPLEDWRWTVDVDLWGTVHGCHVFTPRLRDQGHGHILNVASAAGLISPPLTPAYNVAKAGVVSLSETLAAELAGSGVGVTVLCPTFFRTRIVANGRFTETETREAARQLIDGGPSAESVADEAIRSVERGELYAVPMFDGRWMWRAKRVIPSASPRLLAVWSAWTAHFKGRRR